MSKSSAFKSLLRTSGATVTASVLDTSRETESEMEISMASDVTHQPSITSPSHQPAAVATTTAPVPVPDEVDNLKFFGYMSGYYSKSETVILQLSLL